MAPWEKVYAAAHRDESYRTNFPKGGASRISKRISMNHLRVAGRGGRTDDRDDFGDTMSKASSTRFTKILRYTRHQNGAFMQANRRDAILPRKS
jgi:hypothetical protein